MAQSLRVERLYPLVVAIVAAAISCLLDLRMKVDASPLLVATVTFGAVATGFVGTSLSILTSLDTPIMQRIRGTPYLDTLKNYLGWALAAGVALSLTGLTGLFFEVSVAPAFVSAWWFFLLFAVGCLWRVGSTMLQVFSERRKGGS